MVTLIDTNYIIRFLTKDTEELFLKSSHFFDDVWKGNIHAIIHPMVLSKCLYVLEWYYHCDRVEAACMLREIFLLKWVVNTDTLALMEALTLYIDTRLDFADCILISSSRISNQQIITFDKEMLKYISKNL